MQAGYSGYSETVSDMAQRPQGDGFWYINRGGRVFTVGNAPQLGGVYLHDIGPIDANIDQVVAIDRTDSGEGYWLLAGSGIVWAFGDAVHHGNGSSLSPILGVTDQWRDLQRTESGKITNETAYAIEYNASGLTAKTHALMQEQDLSGAQLNRRFLAAARSTSFFASA